MCVLMLYLENAYSYPYSNFLVCHKSLNRQNFVGKILPLRVEKPISQLEFCFTFHSPLAGTTQIHSNKTFQKISECLRNPPWKNFTHKNHKIVINVYCITPIHCWDLSKCIYKGSIKPAVALYVIRGNLFNIPCQMVQKLMWKPKNLFKMSTKSAEKNLRM